MAAAAATIRCGIYKVAADEVGTAFRSETRQQLPKRLVREGTTHTWSAAHASLRRRRVCPHVFSAHSIADAALARIIRQLCAERYAVSIHKWLRSRRPTTSTDSTV